MLGLSRMNSGASSFFDSEAALPRARPDDRGRDLGAVIRMLNANATGVSGKSVTVKAIRLASES